MRTLTKQEQKIVIESVLKQYRSDTIHIKGFLSLDLMDACRELIADYFEVYNRKIVYKSIILSFPGLAKLRPKGKEISGIWFEDASTSSESRKAIVRILETHLKTLL